LHTTWGLPTSFLFFLLRTAFLEQLSIESNRYAMGQERGGESTSIRWNSLITEEMIVYGRLLEQENDRRQDELHTISLDRQPISADIPHEALFQFRLGGKQRWRR
jgi:hypothetical protein